MIEFLTSGDAIMALITLTFLEVVLGIDNIIFISIAAGKLPEDKRKKATNVGLVLALVQRIILLFFVSFLTQLKEPFLKVETEWIEFGLSWQGLILFVGGVFLLYKSTSEIREKIEVAGHSAVGVKAKAFKSFSQVIIQILIIDFVFSIDSILTAVGMTNGISPDPSHGLMLMIIAVVISMIIMIAFANRIRIFIEKNPSMQVLGLAFLILIAFLLVVESAHLSHMVVFGKGVGEIPKGYLYFAIAFSLGIEFINIRIKKNQKKVKK
ncbi:MAG: TerC family protein [Brumimicrobium sp.]|nr:TerC family protein [Brumimicrobium sp.]